jgi:hypothetical protein
LKKPINTEVFNYLDHVAAPLYVECPGGSYGAWLCLNEHGECSLEVLGPWVYTFRTSLRDCRTLVWPLPHEIKGHALQKMLTSDRVLQLLQRVHDGQEVEWDGQRWSGHLDDDADEANAELEQIFECEWNADDTWSFMSAHEWLTEYSLNDVWPAGKSLQEAAEYIIRDAENKGTLVGSTTEMESALRVKLLKQVRVDKDFEPTPEQLAALDD